MVTQLKPQVEPLMAEVEMKKVAEAVGRARKAQAIARTFTQREVDDVVRAVSWACYQDEHARTLAELSVRETGMGNEPDRVLKVRRKALMMMRDLAHAPSVGVIGSDRKTGLTEIAKPVGVVAALCPSTHPATDLMAKAMMVLKGRNAMVASPSPGAIETSELACTFIRHEIERIGAPADLIQIIHRPSKAAAVELMRRCDAIAVTGSASNVRAASISGAPVYAGGAGNVPVVIEPSADLAKAAADIALSKTFDYATACSSESALVIQETVYDEMVAQLVQQGGAVLSPVDRAKLAETMWPSGRLNPKIVGRAADIVAQTAGIMLPEGGARFFIVEEGGIGPGFEFSGEKITVTLAVYRYADFDDAVSTVQKILAHQGAGHSCGIHTSDLNHALQLAERADVARVIVNQPQGPAEAGSFTNGLPATMILGCGTWQGNSVSGNITYEHFLNRTYLAQPLPERVPTENELWGEYLRTHR